MDVSDGLLIDARSLARPPGWASILAWRGAVAGGRRTSRDAEALRLGMITRLLFHGPESPVSEKIAQ